MSDFQLRSNILFRGKRDDNNEWVEGRALAASILPINQEFYVNNKTHKITDSENITCFTVFPETIGQYTGLTDKNGKKIFEGDIVCYLWGHEEIPLPFYIEFVDGRFLATPPKVTDDVWSIGVSFSYEFEVIGNIYDNPELLYKEGQQ